jgi:acetylornithine deacetylase
MNVFELTRALVDVESITGNEEHMGNVLFAHVLELASKYAGHAERIQVEPKRFNVFACWGNPVVTLSTHIDTVPPFFRSREDETHIWGRGACDTKGIIAAMIFAVRELLEQGTRDIGLLFVVGEERNSVGAFAAAKDPRGSKFLINGEPTENKLAIGSKGALRLELRAGGRMAHSAYPELGESAINKLIQALHNVLHVELPAEPGIGPSTLNIGLIEGGRAPNVIADKALAQVMVRLVGPSDDTRAALEKAIAGLAEIEYTLEIPFMRFGTVQGMETMVASFATDIPALTNWGEPLLLGPGSIHVAHTPDERLAKRELFEAIDLYTEIAGKLVA